MPLSMTAFIFLYKFSNKIKSENNGHLHLVSHLRKKIFQSFILTQGFSKATLEQIKVCLLSRVSCSDERLFLLNGVLSAIEKP